MLATFIGNPPLSVHIQLRRVSALGEKKKSSVFKENKRSKGCTVLANNEFKSDIHGGRRKIPRP